VKRLYRARPGERNYFLILDKVRAKVQTERTMTCRWLRFASSR